MMWQKAYLYFTWNCIFRVDSAAGWKGDSWCVVLFVSLSVAVEQQQSQEQNNQDDKYNSATDGSPGLLFTGRKGNHNTAWLFRWLWFQKW